MKSSTLVQFSKLVSDSTTSEGIFSLLGTTVVEECEAFHALVFGTNDEGEFRVLSSFGACDERKIQDLALEGVCTVADLRSAVTTACGPFGYGLRVIPLISETALFGVLVVLYLESHRLDAAQWTLVEGLTELTAISLNKTYQHQKLQKAFDDLRISQDALVRAEKFRALGQMSAGIAHDLKNLLNPLLLYTDELRDTVGINQSAYDILERIDRILARGVETVERLRAFSRQSSEDSDDVPTDLNAMVREAIAISKPKLTGIDLQLCLGKPPLTVIRPADCVTAIVNLILNSVDALEGKGKITLSTGELDGGAWVEVMDNGPGIPPQIKDRIVEPFFTTKGDVGTGLGVSVVFAFTQRYGGRLEIESEQGHGAKFRMWFPAR